MPSSVCVVDDEVGLLELVQDLFEGLYNVRGFESPVEASKAIQEGYRPNLMIADIKMPGMNGFELRNQIGSIMPDLPFVVVSGYATKEHLLRAFELEADGFLEKPFDVRALTKVTKAALENVRGQPKEATSIDLYKNSLGLSLELTEHYKKRLVKIEDELGSFFLDQEEIPDQIEFLRTESRLREELDKETLKIFEISKNQRSS